MDPVIFGQTDQDHTCNNRFIKLFISWTKYKSESTNSSIKWCVIISNFYPYLNKTSGSVEKNVGCSSLIFPYIIFLHPLKSTRLTIFLLLLYFSISAWFLSLSLLFNYLLTVSLTLSRPTLSWKLVSSLLSHQRRYHDLRCICAM